jgi:hypothetical protein
MKRITLQIGLTMAMLLIAGGMYSQTAVNNTIRLTSVGTTNGPGGVSGSEGPTITSDDTNVNIDGSGVVTVTDNAPTDPIDYTPTAASGITTGTVTLTDALSKTFAIRLKGAALVDQTSGSTYGAITTAGGIDRDSSGSLGVRQGTVTGGIQKNEGITFGLITSAFPTTITFQISRIYFGAFGTGTAGTESAVIVNRRDTSKKLDVLSAASGNTLIVDVSSLDLNIRGGSSLVEMVSIFNNNAIDGTTTVWTITNIEIKVLNTSDLTTVWNGTTWSAFNPSPTMNAVIAGNYSATTAGGFSAKTLTVNSGSLTIGATKNLKIENGITNNAGPTGIIVEDGGTLQQVQTGTNSGTITVRKNSNSLKRGDYTLWSSPVVGSQTLADFSPLTSQSPVNRFYIYDNTLGTSGLYANIAPSATFATGTGYLIRMPNEDPAIPGTSSDYYLGTSSITFNGEFVGVPNNGTITLGSTIPLTSDKFYAIGNPYPSNISADSFINGNDTGGILYFWRKTNAAAGTAYATYTLLGGVGTDAGNGGLGVPNGIIAPCQGFIVKTGTEATTITFTNAMRVQNGTYGSFFKTKAVTTKDRVWLNLSNTAGAFSQTLVGYMDGATLGVDNGIDGKYFNDSAIALTSNINDEEYTIQGRPAFDATDVVALNFKTDVAGDYSIALNHFDGVFAAGQDVYLVDNKMSTETNLKTGAYNFTAVAGVDNSRFTLKYQKTLKVIDSEFNDNSITVYGTNGTLFVKSRLSAINSIKVFDIQGRLIAEQKNVKSNTAAVANLKTNQALIVQVSTEDNKVVSKKVLN